MRIALLRNFIFIYLISTVSTSAFAAKFDFYFGAFDFTAETATDEGAVSGIGAYKIGILLPLFEKLEAGLGYTLVLSDTFTGDAAFGLDLEANYYPFTSHSAILFQTDRVSAKFDSIWKPFVSLSYHARQFQSVSTQYTGFGIGAGFERALSEKFNLKGLFRYASLAGANDGLATEIVILSGITFSF